MAWVESRGKSFRLSFRFNDRLYRVNLKSPDRQDAEACRIRLEENLRLVERGRIAVPTGADLGLFLISDGKLEKSVEIVRMPTLGDIVKRYQETFTKGAKEEITRRMEDIHLAHLMRIIGEKRPLSEITSGTIQQFIDARSREQHNGHPLKAKTIKKAVATLRYVWNWSFRQGQAPMRYPGCDLVYAKERQAEPFRTYEQIQSIIARSPGLTPKRLRELWDGLFLNPTEVAEVLEHVKRRTKTTWLYPFLVVAAHTGARRSELFRSRVEDFDFEARLIHFREKKRSHSNETQRTVDMTDFVAEVMTDFLETKHPGGEVTFATVPNELIVDTRAWRVFRTGVSGSKWEVLRGFHAFRHSFASNLAAAGVDSRVICELMGHQTAEMEARYRHLFPAQRRSAVMRVYGPCNPHSDTHAN
jgi:integrase